MIKLVFLYNSKLNATVLFPKSTRLSFEIINGFKAFTQFKALVIQPKSTEPLQQIAMCLSEGLKLGVDKKDTLKNIGFSISVGTDFSSPKTMRKQIELLRSLLNQSRNPKGEASLPPNRNPKQSFVVEEAHSLPRQKETVREPVRRE